MAVLWECGSFHSELGIHEFVKAERILAYEYIERKTSERLEIRSCIEIRYRKKKGMSVMYLIRIAE